jgi:hypothetical protein
MSPFYGLAEIDRFKEKQHGLTELTTDQVMPANSPFCHLTFNLQIHAWNRRLCGLDTGDRSNRETKASREGMLFVKSKYSV